MKDIKPLPPKKSTPPDIVLVTTIDGSYFPEKSYDCYSRSPGKLTSKPDDTHRKRLQKRAADHIALVNKMVPKSMLKSPSQKRSENARKKVRIRGERECPQDFADSDVVKE